DLETGLSLVWIARDQFTRYGTDESQTIDNQQSNLLLRATRACLGRFDPPWRDFTGFRTYWTKEGMGGQGGWQKRRDAITEFFGPAQDELGRAEHGRAVARLAEPVSPHNGTGWTAVDEEVGELRRLFRAAQTTQDYRDVG